MTVQNLFEACCPSTLEGMFGEMGINVKTNFAQNCNRQAEILTGDKLEPGAFKSGSAGFMRTITSPFVAMCAECGNMPRLMRVMRNNRAGRGGDWFVACACGETSGFHSQPILAVREWSRVMASRKKKARAK